MLPEQPRKPTPKKMQTKCEQKRRRYEQLMADVAAFDAERDVDPTEPSMYKAAEGKDGDWEDNLDRMEYNQHCVEFFSQHFGPGYLKLMFTLLHPRFNSGDIFKISDGRAI